MSNSTDPHATTVEPRSTPASKKPGRPRGKKTAPLAHARREPSRCPSCGSTQREPYFNKRETEWNHVDDDGNPITHVVIQRTKCRDCGQLRDDRHHENRPKEPKRSARARPARLTAASTHQPSSQENQAHLSRDVPLMVPKQSRDIP